MADKRIKRVYFNWEQQNDLSVVTQALIAKNAPGVLNSKGEVVESVVIQYLLKHFKNELKKSGEWDKFEQKAREEGTLWEV